MPTELLRITICVILTADTVPPKFGTLSETTSIQAVVIHLFVPSSGTQPSGTELRGTVGKGTGEKGTETGEMEIGTEGGMTVAADGSDHLAETGKPRRTGDVKSTFRVKKTLG